MTDQTDHRAVADHIMRQGATATERLLAAIHDLLDERLPKPSINPGGHIVAGGAHEAGGCRECEPDTLVEALDALPEGSLIRLGGGSRYRKNREGNWEWLAVKQPVARTSEWVAGHAPIGITSIPGEDVLPHDCDNDGHYWESKLCTAVETCRECGTARRAAPEPYMVTVTLRRRVVERLIKSANEVAGTYRMAGDVVDAELREGAAVELEWAYHDALDGDQS